MAQRLTETKTAPRVVGLLIALAVLPYLNALTAGFTLDDVPNIRENPAVIHGIDLTEVFATPMPMLAYLYRPLTVLSFAANEALMPGNAAAFHAVNLLLHAGVTILVFWLGVRLFDARIALIAAALFALHPLHTEAVTSIVGRAELLAAFFGLLAVLSAGAIDAATGRSRWMWYGCSVLCFTAAVFSKENAVTILPLVLLYRITRRAEPLFAGMWKEVSSLSWLPYALCFGVFLFFRFMVIGTLGAIPGHRVAALDNVLAFVPWTWRVRSALGVLWDYFGLLTVPLVLSADYSYDQVPVINSWLEPRCAAGVLLLCVAAAGAVWTRRPAVRFAVAVPFVALLLTANLLFPIGTVKAERLLYFPSVGWALVTALIFDRLLQMPRYRSMCTAVLVLVVVAFSARTWARNNDWQDDITLARSAGASAPGSAKALSNFGVALLKQGHTAAAIQQFHAALAIYPMDESAFGIGTALNEQGKTDEGIEWLLKAIEIAPSLLKAHTDLCRVLWQRGDFAAAARACRNGLRHDPADANLLKGLGSSLMGAGETEKGMNILRRSLARNPDDDELRSFIASYETVVARRDEEREVRQ